MQRKNVTAILAIVMSLSMWLPAAPECGAQVFLFEWGQPGSGDGQFNSPSGIAVDSVGNVYVADTANNRIQKFDDQGTFLLKWGSAGSGAGQFTSPNGVAVDSTGNVYVVDSANHRIQKFTSSGGFITAWGSQGTGTGQLDQPFGVAVDSQDNVYVTDTGNDRVQKFSPSGAFVTAWGVTGDGPGQFQSPQAIAAWYAADRLTDLIYVGDGTSRIQALYPDGSVALELGREGQRDGQFGQVGGIVVAARKLLVADSGNCRVQQFPYYGGFELKWGIYGREESQFERPAGVTGTEDVVYVVDAGNNRIQAFGPTLPAIYDLDHSLSYNLSWIHNRSVANGGLNCSLPADTIQNVGWTSTYGMTFMGGQYSGYVSGISMVLTMTYAGEQRTLFEQIDLALQSSSRAVGTIYVVEVDSNGNYCAYEGDAVLNGTASVVQPVTPYNPYTGEGVLGDNIGGGGGCFIASLLP
jgi:DNA-binding beta-propeller fold protein YncE